MQTLNYPMICDLYHIVAYTPDLGYKVNQKHTDNYVHFVRPTRY